MANHIWLQVFPLWAVAPDGVHHVDRDDEVEAPEFVPVSLLGRQEPGAASITTALVLSHGQNEPSRPKVEAMSWPIVSAAEAIFRSTVTVYAGAQRRYGVNQIGWGTGQTEAAVVARPLPGHDAPEDAPQLGVEQARFDLGHEDLVAVVPDPDIAGAETIG